MAIDRSAAGRQLMDGAGEAFSWVAIADAEVRLAQARHPGQADLVYHAWPLLARPYWLPDIPFVYAGYIRELLDRAAGGRDTRPGTAAEMALACSLVIDLKSAEALAGLYHRMWVRAFPGHLAYEGQDKRAAWYEQHGRCVIDVYEAELRRRLTQPRRRLPDGITCDGWHGDCRFAAIPL